MSSVPVYVPSRIRTTHPLHEPRQLTAEQREVFRQTARVSRDARRAADAGTGAAPLHPINRPRFEPNLLMPRREVGGMSALSLFSGGGGLDLGFERAGFAHVGAWEWLEAAGDTLRMNRPAWEVHSGPAGDVRQVNWRRFRGEVTVLHGGPPCQPFSNAGKQRGATDPRDMWPEFVRAVLEVLPDAFVAENVAALGTSRFSEYVDGTIVAPLSQSYHIARFVIQAHEVGIPQSRRRLIFVGFKRRRDLERWVRPAPRFRRAHDPGDLPVTPGLRWALGLSDIGFDDIAPTIRSGLSGPRNTTSVLSSVSAQRRFEALGVWPNGVAATRQAARAFVAKNGHFRMSVPDVGLIQGFPESWAFAGATYMQLGQIGNAVAPPVGYEIATSVAAALGV